MIIINKMQVFFSGVLENGTNMVPRSFGVLKVFGETDITGLREWVETWGEAVWDQRPPRPPSRAQWKLKTPVWIENRGLWLYLDNDEGEPAEFTRSAPPFCSMVIFSTMCSPSVQVDRPLEIESGGCAAKSVLPVRLAHLS